MRYVIASVKQSEVFEGPIEEAIARAIEIENEHCPAYGVYIAHEGAQCKDDILWESAGDWSIPLIESSRGPVADYQQPTDSSSESKP